MTLIALVLACLAAATIPGGFYITSLALGTGPADGTPSPAAGSARTRPGPSLLPR